VIINCLPLTVNVPNISNRFVIELGYGENHHVKNGIDGYQILVEQAEEQYKLWWKEKPKNLYKKAIKKWNKEKDSIKLF